MKDAVKEAFFAGIDFTISLIKNNPEILTEEKREEIAKLAASHIHSIALKHSSN